MRKARAPLLVGLVVLLGVGAFIGMYSVTRKGFEAGEDTYRLYALFDDVSGLGPGTRVTVAGVQVGQVELIAIDDEFGDLARVTILVEDGVKLYRGEEELPDGSWRNGATITRRQASLLGDQYLELKRGAPTPDNVQLGNGDEIRNVVSVSGLSAIMKDMERAGSIFEQLDATFQKLDAIASDVKAVTGTVRNILSGPVGEQRLGEIAENIRTASGDITAVVVDVKAFVADAKAFTGDVRGFLGESVLGRGDQIGRIVNNVERFSQNAANLSAVATTSAAGILDDVKVVTGDIRGLIRGSRDDVETSLGTIKGALAQFTNTMQRLDTALNNLASITGKIDEGAGTLGRLVNDDTVIRDIETVVSDAGDFVSRVTNMQTRVELSSEYYVGQRALKNYLRLRLQPKEDKYYLIELIDDPRGKTVFSSQVTQTNDPSLPPVVHESSAETSEGIKFSFQFAKRWYFITGRFGVIEGTGGIGVDFEFFEDSLRLTTDLFDFSQDEAPRIRMRASYAFLEHFYLSAGVDDVANESSFDWFFGGGIRFTDDDFKALLTVAPTPSL